MTANTERFQRVEWAAMALRLFRRFAKLPQGRWADAQRPAHFAGAFYASAVRRGGDSTELQPTEQLRFFGAELVVADNPLGMELSQSLQRRKNVGTIRWRTGECLLWRWR